jgi:RNA ligase
MHPIRKYPRTRHIIDSALQPGDEGLERAGFADIAGRSLVVEEKVDGANSAVSFADDGQLLLQSRGHYLSGGSRERHFDRLKSWAFGMRDALWPVLSDRYIVYGEWTYAKHTVFYDALPHYFLEFDVLDRTTDRFLDTPGRRALLAPLGLSSVPVLHSGAIASAQALKALIGPSAYKSRRWREALAEAATVPPLDAALTIRQTDPSDLMEGLYIKVEEGGTVTERYKFVRPDFLSVVFDSETHWHSRPILPNQLRGAGTP